MAFPFLKPFGSCRKGILLEGVSATRRKDARGRNLHVLAHRVRVAPLLFDPLPLSSFQQWHSRSVAFGVGTDCTHVTRTIGCCGGEAIDSIRSKKVAAPNA